MLRVKGKTGERGSLLPVLSTQALKLKYHVLAVGEP